MNRDTRLYHRSTLIQAGLEEDVVDSLEIVGPLNGKDERFQLLTDASTLQIPSCSYISRSIDDAWFLDTGVEIDEGQLYIGRTDFEGLASVAGYISKSRVSRIVEENGRLRHDLAMARNIIDGLRNVVARMVGTQTVEVTESGSLTQRAVATKSRTRRESEDVEDLDIGFDS